MLDTNRSPRWLVAFITTFALAVGPTLSGCGEEDEGGGPTMRPGQACLSCHDDFSAAGTVYADMNGSAARSGVTVTLVDDASQTVNLTSNSAGNFYTSESLTFPVTIHVVSGTDEATMLSANSGDCNSCHSASGSAGAPVFLE
jgi:hypothetical protein